MAQIRYIVLTVAAACVVALGAPQLAQAEARYNSAGSTAPDGLWLAGGLNATSAFNYNGPDGAGIRLEAGIPLTLVGPGQLTLVLPLSTETEGHGHGVRLNTFMFSPEVQWQYILPIHMKHQFSISPQLGMGFGGEWVHDSNVGNQGAFMLNFKTGVVARFVFDFGLLLEMQPLGFTFNIPFGNPFDFFAAYEWYAAVGYRFK